MTERPDGTTSPLPEVSGQGIAKVASGLELELEAPIIPLRVGYERIGRLEAPAVVVLGGISAEAHICAHQGDPREGWWQRLAGVGLPLDAGALQLIGMDWVGGPGRSSQPAASVDPDGIPAVTTADQARALAGLLDHLGLERVAAIVGASYGAMVGLAFGAIFPHRASRIVAISGAHQSHPMATALRALQRRIALLGARSGDPRRGLVLARALAMTTYRSAEEFNERFGMAPRRDAELYRFEVEDYLEHQGEAFAERFELAHFLCLCQSLDLHRVDPQAIGTPTTLIAITEDTLVPLWQMRGLHRALADRSELMEIDSPYGHDAFLVEEESVGGALRRILAEIVEEGTAPPFPEASPTPDSSEATSSRTSQ
ncbi:MAG: homoserine O-succinyltransferase [Gemmatimonadota bacterium]